MYSFKNLTNEQAVMIGSIVSNKARRAERALKMKREDLEYQRENAHIFLKDGTIDATEKSIISLIARTEAARQLLAAITV